MSLVTDSFAATMRNALASSCTTTKAWGDSQQCQTYFPSGHQEALDLLSQGGCTGLDQSAFQARIDDLTQNWHPSGVYTCSDLNAIVGRVMDMANAQHNAVMAMQTGYDPNYLDTVATEYNNIGQQAVTYTQRCNAYTNASGQTVAEQPGDTLINAPGLRVWVITAMSAMLDGMTSLAVAACQKPFWLDALGQFDNAMGALWGIAKGVAGAAAELAMTALNVAESAVHATAWIVRWAPWLGLIALGVGFFFWNKKTQRFPKLLPASMRSVPLSGFGFGYDEDDGTY